MSEPANTKRRYEITRAQLPVCCPLPGQSLWNAHPRVYLPLPVVQEAVCPYCEAHFVWVDKE